MEVEDIGSGDGRPPGAIRKVAVSIYRYFPHGGLQKDMMNTVQALLRRNIEVTIFCMSWESDVFPENVTVRRLRLHGATSYARAHKFDLALARVLRKRRFDLHLSFNKVSGADCYFVDDFPFVRGKVSPWQRLFSPRYRIFSRMERQVFNSGSDALIFCLSQAQKNSYQTIYSTAEPRFRILPPGLDEKFRNVSIHRNELRKKMREQLNLEDDEQALFLIGSAFYTKGADRAIAALAAWQQNRKSRAKLFIVGRNEHKKLQLFARRCGVEDKLFFLDARNDIPELLCAADLLLHPARSEAAGIVMLEALCCGTPVICTGNCGYASYVEDAGSVVLPHPFRQKHLNRTLKLSLSMPGRIDELQQEASAYTQAAGSEFFRRSEVVADTIMEKLNQCVLY